MNTLTPNRILQKGDEYCVNPVLGQWLPVPKEEIGTQVLFSKLKGKQFRRPTETPQVLADNGKAQQEAFQRLQETRSAENAKPISPDGGVLPAGGIQANTAKAENEKTPAPTRSGAGESRLEELPAVTAEAIERAGLPTVVSPKAHQLLPLPKELEKAVENLVRSVAAIDASIPIPPPPETLKNHSRIKYPGLGAMKDLPRWRGRNGTFNGYGIELLKLNGDEKIALTPIGKRGSGNCFIEIPVSVIPQIIDWLSKQTT